MTQIPFPIVLLTDFGNSDAYVGIMKGVIAQISPHTTVIDLAHDLPPFSIRHASYLLYASRNYFPQHTIFVTVVDPGVGSQRKPILLETEQHYFIAPDNGVLSMLLTEEKSKRLIHLNNKEFFLSEQSATFHGRDIFAPAAAHLSKGADIAKMGTALEQIQVLENTQAHIAEGYLVGEIICIDRFGNAISNISQQLLMQYFPSLELTASIENGNRTNLFRLCSHYAEGREDEPIMLFGSCKLLEICVNQGSAQELLDINIGDTLRIALPEKN